MPNIMHRGAGKIALRVLGQDTDENRRIVYRWSSEVSAPFTIHKDGRTIFCWESDLEAAQGGPAIDAPAKDDPAWGRTATTTEGTTATP